MSSWKQWATGARGAVKSAEKVINFRIGKRKDEKVGRTYVTNDRVQLATGLMF